MVSFAGGLASTSGHVPGVICKHLFASTGGTRRDFFLGCTLAIAAIGWCRVLTDRWVLPHHAVRASFCIETWTAMVCVPVRATLFGLLAGLLFAEVGRI